MTKTLIFISLLLSACVSAEQGLWSYVDVQLERVSICQDVTHDGETAEGDHRVDAAVFHQSLWWDEPKVSAHFFVTGSSFGRHHLSSLSIRAPPALSV